MAFECFPSTFKGKFYFQGLLRQSCIFKYFSSLCDPVEPICLLQEFQSNQSKNLMQVFTLPDDALHKMIKIGKLTLEIFFFENVIGG